MPELTDDEFTLLLIAKEGEYLAPIGRWKPSILALAERGLLRRENDVNYTITQVGRRACDRRDSEDFANIQKVLESDRKTIEARAEEPTIAEELKDGGT